MNKVWQPASVLYILDEQTCVIDMWQGGDEVACWMSLREK